MTDEDVIGDNGANAPKVIKVNYPGNSHKDREGATKSPSTAKPADKKITKVITGEVVQKKKGLWSKFRDTFAGDNLNNVGAFILNDIVVPAVKTMISDAVGQGVERTLFGESSSRSAGRSSSRRGYTNYSSFSSSRNPAGRAGERDEPRTISNRARAVHDFDDIVLVTRGEAEEVIDALTDVIKEYDVVTVSDLFEMVGITGSFTDEKWGWFDMRGAGVQRVRDGYLLNLPKTSPID